MNGAEIGYGNLEVLLPMAVPLSLELSCALMKIISSSTLGMGLGMNVNRLNFGESRVLAHVGVHL